ncbi:MAG: hypothetical protein ACKPKO_21510, partial [Candidatus Fonsibacter sp.]
MEKKIELYLYWANKDIDAGQLDYNLMSKVLRDLMDQNNMSALWSRLNTALNNTASQHVQETWDKICERGMFERSSEKKAEVLCVNLAFGNN